MGCGVAHRRFRANSRKVYRTLPYGCRKHKITLVLRINDNIAQEIYYFLQEFSMASLIEEAIKEDINRTTLTTCNNFLQTLPPSVCQHLQV